MTDNYRTIYQQLPYKIRGFVVHNANEDFYTIVLNSRLAHNQNIKTFWHELKHITNDDFNSELSVDVIEKFAHAN